MTFKDRLHQNLFDFFEEISNFGNSAGVVAAKQNPLQFVVSKVLFHAWRQIHLKALLLEFTFHTEQNYYSFLQYVLITAKLLNPNLTYVKGLLYVLFL